MREPEVLKCLTHFRVLGLIPVALYGKLFGKGRHFQNNTWQVIGWTICQSNSCRSQPCSNPRHALPPDEWSPCHLKDPVIAHLSQGSSPFWPAISPVKSRLQQSHCLPSTPHFQTTLFRPGIDMRPGSSNHKWTALSTGVNTLKMHWGRIDVRSLRPHSEVVWATYDHILLAVCTRMCPGPHWRTAYSTDVPLGSAGSLRSSC